MRHGETRGSRRARRLGGRVFAPHQAAAVIIVVLLVAAATAAACGGPSSGDLGPYLGEWQRVESGAPDPDFTLTVVAQSEGASLTFANLTNGMDQTVAGTLEDGYIACLLPNADVESVASPLPGVPSESELQIGLGENGQLIVDLVLSDGTLEPIWVYQRADGVSPTP